MNFFELLSVTPSFELDLAQLESNYFQKQRQYHPDRFVGKPAAERQQALQISVDINKAYDTLKDPLSRAQYLLQLQGMTVGTDAGGIKPSPQLLTEIMELREQVEQTKHPHTIKETLDAMISQSIDIISARYGASDWPAMAQETLRLGYLVKTQHDVDHALMHQRKHVL